MKKVVLAVVLAVAVAATLGAGSVLAQSTAAPVVVTGDNVGLIKTLASAEAANASAAVGALNVLKVTEAKTADGKPIADLAGKVLHYVPTKAADSLLLGDAMQGKKIKVTGKLFKAEASLLVEKVEEATAAAPAAPAAAPAAPGDKPAAPAPAKGKDDFEDIPVKSKSGLQVL